MTGPGGGPCSGPRKSRSKPRRREGSEGVGKKSAAKKGPAKSKVLFWHDSLNDSVKGMLEEKGIRTTTGTIDVSVGDARVKLGTNGYSSVAHAGRLLAEGLFTCDVAGNTTFTWEHCITFDEARGQWVASADKSMLPAGFCLADGTFFLFVVVSFLQGYFKLRIAQIIMHIPTILYQLMYFLSNLKKMLKVYGET